MNEYSLQNLIRIELSKLEVVTFRANVGQTWIGDNRIRHNLDGSITIYNPRRFKTGLPKGFPDIFGVTSDGRAVFIEVKSPAGKVTLAQENFLRQMAAKGALAGVARSVEEAVNIIKSSKEA